MLIAVNRNPSPAELRKFGWTILVGLGVIGALIWWWKGEAALGIAMAFWAVGVVVAVISMGAPSAGRRVYVTWMLAATGMGMVMIPLFMTVLFIVLLPVFSLIRFKDPLRLKLRKSGSYWERHKPHEATVDRMLRPF